MGFGWITKLFEGVDWKISKGLVGYDFAISEMENRVLEIKQNSAKELVWLLEHETIYTGGTSAKKEDLKNIKNKEKAIHRNSFYYVNK